MSQSMIYILITGTNGGLGLGICTRLIDDFVSTKPTTSSLTLIFTTRSARKSKDTLTVLQAHLSKHPRDAQTRIHFQPENVDLTNLLSVRSLARKLLASPIPQLNSVILNAGIGGWVGMNWPHTIRDTLLDIVTNTTWPTFKLGAAGLITDPQFPSSDPATPSSEPEPPLGQIFCANLFGHYTLTHNLMPLLRACDPGSPARIIWVSSIEPRARHFHLSDIQALRSTEAYESSKRLTDILVLTYNSPSAAHAVREFIAVQKDERKREIRSMPTMHESQPGICTTSIFSLYWIVFQFYVLGIYMARWAGSPWATVDAYLAAMSFSWLALAGEGEVQDYTRKMGGSGNVKWGTAVTRSGQASVKPTEVEDWGVDGGGRPFAQSWWGGRYGRAPGSRDATGEDVERFLGLGRDAWREMERLRVEWDGRVDEFEQREK